MAAQVCERRVTCTCVHWQVGFKLKFEALTGLRQVNDPAARPDCLFQAGPRHLVTVNEHHVFRVECFNQTDQLAFVGVSGERIRFQVTLHIQLVLANK